MNLKQNEKLFGEFPAISTQEWEAAINADLKGADYQKKLVWKTEEGFDVKPYYRSEDLAELTYLNQLPNADTCVRGQKTAGNNWEIVQFIKETDPVKANAIAHESINRGANVVSFNCSKVVDAESLKSLLDRIDIEEVGIRFKQVSSYPEFVDLFINELKSRNIDMGKVTGSIDFDPICYMLLHKSFFVNQDNDLNELIHVVKKVILNIPNFHALTVNADLIHNSGSNISQEMGYGLAWANEYMAYAIEKGISAKNVANTIMFSMAVGSNYFMEIAKFRAFRMLWSKIAEQYGVKGEDLKIYIHTNGSIWNKSLYDSNVNMLRSTTEGMAAVIGGINSLSLQAYDLVFKTDDDFSRRISRNVQLILKHESYFDKIVDPAAGSYYIETLTDNLARKVWSLFQETESKGGFMKLGLDGEVKKSVEAVAQKRDLDIANRKTTILGTNQYPNPTEFMLDRIEEYNKCYTKDYEGLKPYRGAKAFEELRLSVEKQSKAKGLKPSVFLLTIGSLAMRKARASFSAGFFGCAGFEIIDNLGFDTPQEGVDAAMKAKSEIVVICSSDEEYAEFAPAIAQGIKAKNSAVKVVVAGNPTEIIDQLKQAGVDDFIHARANVLDKLTAYCKELGIL
jgi:methylmalonyl-CoA mutase